MIKPKTKADLMKILTTKTFKVILIEEGKANLIANQLKNIKNKEVTVIVLE